MAIRIKLSPAQKEAVEWAFSPLWEYWGGPCEDGGRPLPDSEGVEENDLVMPDGATMPYLDGNTLPSFFRIGTRSTTTCSTG
jgi:hypothetical protein